MVNYSVLSSHALMKSLNRAKVLETMRQHAPLSRSEIAKITGLDRKSITNFVAELIDEGLVFESGKKANMRGRSFTMLEFSKDTVNVAGIAIYPDAVKGVLVNICGEKLFDAESEFEIDSSVDVLMDAVQNVYKQLKDKSEKPLTGIGISIPGIIDIETGVVKESVNIPCLNGKDCSKAFAEFMTETLYFEDMSRAKALAEKWFGLGRDKRDFVCIDLNIGIGAGIINDRRLYRGAGNFAGEIGHVVIEKEGRKCRCGNLGCLEQYLSENVLLSELNEALGENFKSIEKIANLNSKAEKVIKDAGRNLGLGLSTIINILNPTTIILNGSITRYEDIVMPEIMTAIRANSLNSCCDNLEILSSELEYAVELGAASCVLSELFEVEGYFYV
ncbi:MAG: ROK family transcriptional regulator [Planctomycetota bacterium]